MTARSKRSAVISVSLLLLFTVGLAAEGRAEKRDRPRLKGKTWIWNFAADTLGLAPAGSRAYGGTWSVELDSALAAKTAVAVAPGDSTGRPDSALAGPRFLRQKEEDDGIAFHYIQFLKPHLKDIEASVRFRIKSGEIDPTAGIAFHLDAKGRNGYIVRVSGATGELVVHYLIYGKRRDLRVVRIDAPEPGAWHTLGVRRQGSVLDVTYDGASILKMRDERFSEGNVGLWTEDDTIVDFADFTVRSL